MAIVNRPHNLPKYLDATIAALDDLLVEQTRAQELIQRHHSDGYSMLRHWLRYGTDGAEVVDHIGGIDYPAKSLDRFLPLQQVRDNLDSVRRFGGDFLKYVMSPRGYRNDLNGFFLECLAALGTAERGAAEYGYDWADPSNAEDPDFIAAKGLLDGCRILHHVIMAGEALLQDVWSRIPVQMEIRAMGYRWEQWRPTHGEVEPLWHASAFAADLVREGFAVEKPAERRGLGLYGEQAGVSFTHEPQIAYAIAGALREMWAVVHGYITAEDIAARLYAEGIERPRIRDTLGLGKYPEELTTETEAAKLYNIYLWIGNQRENPVFTNVDKLVDLLRERELSDIGVVLCEVRLSGNDEYKVGESEFIVTPDRVLSIKFDPNDQGPQAVGLEPDLEAKRETALSP
jgi:hypothetical protein